MDLTTTKPVIISCGVGGWYPAGVERLERSLIYHGYAGDMMLYKNEYPPNCPPHSENPYAFKIYAYREAMRRGYNLILWVDSSFWAVKNPMPIFDKSLDCGIVSMATGYSCAQTCTDELLSVSGISRDEAEHIPEVAGGFNCFYMENQTAKSIFETWSHYCDMGLFKTSREHNPLESDDARFLFSRQDQSALSIACHKHNSLPNSEGMACYYDDNHAKQNPIFFICGI